MGGASKRPRIRPTLTSLAPEESRPRVWHTWRRSRSASCWRVSETGIRRSCSRSTMISLGNRRIELGVSRSGAFFLMLTVSIVWAALGATHQERGLQDPTRDNCSLQLVRRGIRSNTSRNHHDYAIALPLVFLPKCFELSLLANTYHALISGCYQLHLP